METLKDDEFICSDCGIDVTADAKTCPKCGASFDETSPPDFTAEVFCELRSMILHWCPEWELTVVNGWMGFPAAPESDFFWSVEVQGDADIWLAAKESHKAPGTERLLWFLDYEGLDSLVEDILLRHAYPVCISQHTPHSSSCFVQIEGTWRPVRLASVHTSGSLFPLIQQPTLYHSTAIIPQDSTVMQQKPWLRGRGKLNLKLIGY